MSNKVLFSEWLKAQQERQDHIGGAARKWLAQPGLDRRGRVNAARLTRQAGIDANIANDVIQAYKTATA